MVVGSVPAGGGPAGGSSATLDHATVLGNFAIGGAGAARGHGYGGGVYVAMGALVTAKDKTAIFANVASTAGNNVFNDGTSTSS
jgi:hypothetical protein